MPQIGERKSKNGIVGEWTGSTWVQVDPGHNMGGTEPGSYLEGFLKSAGETARKTAGGVMQGVMSAPGDTLNSILHPIDTVKGLASTVAHPLDTIKALSDPETGGRAIGGLLAGGVAGRVLPPVMRGVVNKGPEALGSVGRGLEAVGAATKKPALSIGAMEGIAHNPLIGGATMAAPYAAEYGGKGLQKLGDVLKGLRSGAASEAEMGPYVPNKSGYKPGGSFGEPALPQEATAVDHYMPNRSGATSDLFEQATKPQGAQPFDWPEAGGHYIPNEIGSHVLEGKAAGAMHDAASAENILRNTNYGEGAVMPNSLPTELRDPVLAGLHEATSGTSAEGMYPYVNVPEDLTFEAGMADMPGLSVDTTQATRPPFTTAPKSSTVDLSDVLAGLGSEAQPISDPSRMLPAFGQTSEAAGSKYLLDKRPLLDLVNERYPDLNVTSLKDYPRPAGSDPLAKAIRQRAKIQDYYTGKR